LPVSRARRAIAAVDRLGSTWWRCKGTRRVGSVSTEQENGLAEPRRAERSDLVDAAGSVEERDQPRGGVAALLDERATRIRRRRRVEGAETAPQLRPDSAPAVQDRSGGQVRRRAFRPVPAQPLEVEYARPEPEDPALDRARGNPALLCDGRHRGPGEDTRRRVHDDLDAGDLARQGIPGQHPLAMTAVTAARQRDR